MYLNCYHLLLCDAQKIPLEDFVLFRKQVMAFINDNLNST